MTDSSSAASATGELSRERDRVVKRLRSMPLTAVPGDRVLVTAQRLADLAAEVAGSPRRTVPSLAPYAAGDQISVLVAEVREATEALDDVSADAVLAGATYELARLRHELSAPGPGHPLPRADTDS